MTGSSSLTGEPLKRAVSLIRDDEDGTYLSSGFDQMAVSIVLSREEGYPRALSAVLNSHRDIQTIAHKVRWLADRRDDGDLDQFVWMYFCTSDIVAFHVQMRSVFDYLARFLSSLSRKRGVAPETFDKLRRWIAKPGRERLLGGEVAKVLGDCEWFEDLRAVRDDLVHRGADTVAFPEAGRILFQVHTGISRRVLIPEVMFNDNVADFELYAGLLWARLVVFLEDLAAALVRAQLVTRAEPGEVKAYNSGLGYLREWANRLIDEEPQTSRRGR